MDDLDAANQIQSGHRVDLENPERHRTIPGKRIYQLDSGEGLQRYEKRDRQKEANQRNTV